MSNRAGYNPLCGYAHNLASTYQVENMFGVELSRCPFCNGPAALHHGPTCHVTCLTCAANGPAIERRNRDMQQDAAYQAVMAWNVRGSPTAVTT